MIENGMTVLLSLICCTMMRFILGIPEFIILSLKTIGISILIYSALYYLFWRLYKL